MTAILTAFDRTFAVKFYQFIDYMEKSPHQREQIINGTKALFTVASVPITTTRPDFRNGFHHLVASLTG